MLLLSQDLKESKSFLHMFDTIPSIPYVELDQHESFYDFPAHVNVTIKRLDVVHPTISGNKFYKLKYNILAAQRYGNTRLLSFGGAYSNHIFALAHAAKIAGLQSIGIIRGEELAHRPLNLTLQAAKDLGMQLHFVSRQEYRLKHEQDYQHTLYKRFPDSFIIPEGGSNAWAVEGCEDILSETDQQNFDLICCAVGTGGTIAGIINRSATHQRVIGLSALKGYDVAQDIQTWVNPDKVLGRDWQIYQDQIFAGYAKWNQTLLDFIAYYQQCYNIPLEPIYTGKALYTLHHLFKQGEMTAYTSQSNKQHPLRILFIHTGGLQAFRHLNHATLTS